VKSETVTDYLFNEFANGVKEHYGSEEFGHVIGVFVGFGDDYCCGGFEV